MFKGHLRDEFDLAQKESAFHACLSIQQIGIIPLSANSTLAEGPKVISVKLCPFTSCYKTKVSFKSYLIEFWLFNLVFDK